MNTLTLQAIEALYNVGVAQWLFFTKKHIAVGSLPNAKCGTPVDLRLFIMMITFEDIAEARWQAREDQILQSKHAQEAAMLHLGIHTVTHTQ